MFSANYLLSIHGSCLFFFCGCRVLTESLDQGASRGHLDPKVTKEPEDSQELQDPSDYRSNKKKQCSFQRKCHFIVILDIYTNIQRKLLRLT